MLTVPALLIHSAGRPRHAPKRYVQRCMDDLVLTHGKIFIVADRDMIGAKMAVWYPDENTLHVSPAMDAFLDSDDEKEIPLIAKNLRVIDLADARLMSHY